MQPEPPRLAGLANGYAAFALAFAAAIVPAPPVVVSAWAEENRVVSAESGSPYPGPWRGELVPHLAEVQDCMSFTHPCESVTVVASAQSAKSEAGVNFIGASIDRAPCPILVVLPTLDEATKYNKVKLQPTIDATPALNAKVLPPNSRDEQSSTAFFKRFRGGFLAVTGANASSGLQMISARALVAEEIAEYPAEAGERGDPLEQAEQRLNAWQARGVKKAYISAPGVKGACRITVKWDASDQRRYYVPCPHCDAYQTLEWSPDRDRGALRWRSAAAPHGAYYVCAANGCIIEHHEKTAMVDRGVWIKTYPEDPAKPDEFRPAFIEADAIEAWRARGSAGRQPGFHWWQAVVKFVPWDSIVAKWFASKDSPRTLKTFWQQVLGLAWEEQGDAPDYDRLFERRENFAWRQVPVGALYLTAAADVQEDRIEWDVYAWDAGFASWRIDGGIVEGKTDDPATWKKLDDVLARRYPDAHGREWEIDAFGVDAGFRSQRVYEWARRHATAGRVWALDGRPGWKLPPLGTPSKRDVDFNGRKIGAVQLWPVGTWDMKSELYAALRKTIEGPDEATGAWPVGAAHFNQDCDKDFFKQVTAEFLVDRPLRGGIVEKVWDRNRAQPNERHDTAVYARALARHMTAGMTPDAYAALAARRGAPPEGVQRDLAALWAPGIAAAPAAPPANAVRRVSDESGPVRGVSGPVRSVT